MPVIWVLSEGDHAIRAPDWPFVSAAIERVSTGESRAMLLERENGDAWLSIAHAAGYGVQVMVFEDGELGEKVLTAPDSERGLVDVVLAGMPQQESKASLVSVAMASQAAQHFLETGSRSAAFTWRDPIELERWAQI
jgi:hypothetical protein